MKLANKHANESKPVTGLMAENGGIFITGTSEITGDFSALQFYEESVIAAHDHPDFDGSLVGETIPGGTIIYGNCISITLTSGACIAYNRTTSMS